MYRPLADEIRPTDLSEVVGQKHILGENGLLRRIIESGSIPNMIFYGPSGCGKTTVARIIADRTNRTLYKLNATTAGISDIKSIISDIDTMMTPNGILLYLDEIQYFNKKQQQSLLEFIENGKITLIASTTENPYFYVYNAILSRCSVFEFKQVDGNEIKSAVLRAVSIMEKRLSVKAEISDKTVEKISFSCGGDVRKAINAVELLFTSNRAVNGIVTISDDDASVLAQRSAMRYDKDGDDHYDLLSALQKSIRGSDPDAAVHYLGRLLEAGDILSPCRRLLVIASEDIGLAYPLAAVITKSCVDSALQLGLPEARIPLAEAAVLLATSPKSNSSYKAINSAMADIRAGISGPVPRNLQNVHAETTGLETGQNYIYPHDFKNHWIKQQYLPDAIKNKKYYEYGENKTEQAAKKYWENIKH